MKCELCNRKFEGHAWSVHRGHHKTGYIKEDGSRNWSYSERSMHLVDRRKAMRIARLEALLKLAKVESGKESDTIDHIEVKVGDHDRAKYENRGIILEVIAHVNGKKLGKAILVPNSDITDAYEEQLRGREKTISDLLLKLAKQS